jgi:lysozyme
MTLADIQRHIGVPADGQLGPVTIAAIAKALGMAEAPATDGWKAAAVKLMHEFEGCRLTAYPDPGSGGVPWTIGWGSTTDEQGKAIAPGTSWTQERADARFEQDVERFSSKVRALLGGAATTDNQFAALTSLAYNIGPGNLGTSTLLKKHRAGDYKGAQAEFAKWNRAAGKVMAGLTRRRAAEAKVYGS